VGEGVRAVINFAAESHVDRSIDDAAPFIRTNVCGTQVLLDAAREFRIERYIQVSTDEVYGSLGESGYFTEETPLAPNSHCAAIEMVWRAGKVGEVYNIGGRCERTNLELTYALLEVMGKPRSLIRYVKDRPGHDRRYAIDCSKIERELDWRPEISFDQGLLDTVKWYQENADWIANIRTGEYLKYYEKHYGK